MKKILLTCVAALISLAAIGQTEGQDQQSDQYRNAESVDSTMNEAGDDLQDAGNDIEDASRRSGQDIQEGMERSQETVEEQAEQAGDDVQEEAEEAGQNIGDAARDGEQNIRQGLERTGDEVESAEEAVESDTTSNPSANGQNPNDSEENLSGSTSSSTEYHDVEIVEDKEGPQGQVVYKFNNEMFYVDRDGEKKLVKVEDESSLRDSKHEIIIKEGGSKK